MHWIRLFFISMSLHCKFGTFPDSKFKFQLESGKMWHSQCKLVGSNEADLQRRTSVSEENKTKVHVVNFTDWDSRLGSLLHTSWNKDWTSTGKTLREDMTFIFLQDYQSIVSYVSACVWRKYAVLQGSASKFFIFFLCNVQWVHIIHVHGGMCVCMFACMVGCWWMTTCAHPWVPSYLHALAAWVIATDYVSRLRWPPLIPCCQAVSSLFIYLFIYFICLGENVDSSSRLRGSCLKKQRRQACCFALEDQLIPLFSSKCLPARAGGRQLRLASVKLQISDTPALGTLVPADTWQVFIFHLFDFRTIVRLLQKTLRQ